MPPREIDFDVVRELARELGDVEEPAVRGAPSLKLGGKLLAWIPINKSAEPGSLAVRIDLADRAELIEAAPDTYYVTGHYLKYPTVLVRMSRIQPGALKDLLRMARFFVTGKSSGSTPASTVPIRSRAPRD